MKLTKSKLKQIIKEEAQKLLREQQRRKARINEETEDPPRNIIDLISLISDESAAMEAEREMGAEAYSDWLAAYKDPYHPEHDAAVLALPAINPASPDFMYPAKSARYRREWDRLTSGNEVVE